MVNSSTEAMQAALVELSFLDLVFFDCSANALELFLFYVYLSCVQKWCLCDGGIASFIFH